MSADTMHTKLLVIFLLLLTEECESLRVLVSEAAHAGYIPLEGSVTGR